jgi:hypothetical protein
MQTFEALVVIGHGTKIQVERAHVVFWKSFLGKYGSDFARAVCSEIETDDDITWSNTAIGINEMRQQKFIGDILGLRSL